MAPRNRDYSPGEQIRGTVYQVVRVLARGGMGTVYDVEDTTIGKPYVLKTLHPQLGDRRDLAKRMQAEARALARLHHPNIVEVVTAGVTGDDLKLPYYVMERLSGQNLRVVLQKKGMLELPHAYHIAIDLLDALDHAHEKGVIHRDVKPENIFLHRTLAGTTVTKLLDFGIMSLVDQGQGLTGGRFLGTLRYASPEQLKGEPPSPKMDLYAAALVIWEMVTGRGPFDEEDDVQRLAAAHMHKVPPRLTHHAPHAPLPLEALLRSALDKDPGRRPPDAFSFAAQLRNQRRTVGGVLDGTEHRETAAAVLTSGSSPSRPPVVRVRELDPTPLARAAVSPAPQAPPASSPPPQASSQPPAGPHFGHGVSPLAASHWEPPPASAPPPVSVPKTTQRMDSPLVAPAGLGVAYSPPPASVRPKETIRGMPMVPTPPPPGVGPRAEPMATRVMEGGVSAPSWDAATAAPSVNPAAPAVVIDRYAPTRSMHGEAMRGALYGTEPMVEIPERPGEKSVAAQVLPPAAKPGPKRVLLAVAVGLFVLLVFAGGGAAIAWTLAHRGDPKPAPSQVTPPAPPSALEGAPPADSRAEPPAAAADPGVASVPAAAPATVAPPTRVVDAGPAAAKRDAGTAPLPSGPRGVAPRPPLDF